MLIRCFCILRTSSHSVADSTLSAFLSSTSDRHSAKSEPSRKRCACAGGNLLTFTSFFRAAVCVQRMSKCSHSVHPVSSNHWGILSSAGLRDAIAWELEREVPSAPDGKAGHDTAAAALAVAPPTPRTRLELRRRR